MTLLSYTAILLLALCLLITYRDYECTADAYAATDVDVLSDNSMNVDFSSIRNTVRRLLQVKGGNKGQGTDSSHSTSDSSVDFDEAYKHVQCTLDDKGCSRRVAKDDATAEQIKASDDKRERAAGGSSDSSSSSAGT